MNKIITYAAMLIIGILIGSLAFYTWTQITNPEAPLNTAYTQYGESGERGYLAFLKILGINGTSDDQLHKNEIEILEYGWGETIDAFTIFNAMGTVTPDYEDFTFVFWWDQKASVPLLTACTKGQVFEQAILSVRPVSSASGEDLIRIRLGSVIVSSFQTKGNVFDGEEPIVEISLSFRIIDIYALSFSETGGVGQSYSFAWNYETNSEP